MWVWCGWSRSRAPPPRQHTVGVPGVRLVCVRCGRPCPRAPPLCPSRGRRPWGTCGVCGVTGLVPGHFLHVHAGMRGACGVWLSLALYPSPVPHAVIPGVPSACLPAPLLCPLSAAGALRVRVSHTLWFRFCPPPCVPPLVTWRCVLVSSTAGPSTPRAVGSALVPCGGLYPPPSRPSYRGGVDTAGHNAGTMRHVWQWRTILSGILLGAVL